MSGFDVLGTGFLDQAVGRKHEGSMAKTNWGSYVAGVVFCAMEDW